MRLQVTHHQLNTHKEEEAKRKEQVIKEKMLAAKREVSEDAYHAMVGEHENRNRLEGEVEARNVAEALSVLAVKDAADADKHPEKFVDLPWTICLG